MRESCCRNTIITTITTTTTRSRRRRGNTMASGSSSGTAMARIAAAISGHSSSGGASAASSSLRRRAGHSRRILPFALMGLLIGSFWLPSNLVNAVDSLDASYYDQNSTGSTLLSTNGNSLLFNHQICAPFRSEESWTASKTRIRSRFPVFLSRSHAPFWGALSDLIYSGGPPSTKKILRE